MNKIKVERSLRVYEGTSLHELYEKVADLDNPRLYFDDDFGDIYGYVRYMEEETDKEYSIRTANEQRAEKAKQAAKEKRRLRFIELQKEFVDE